MECHRGVSLVVLTLLQLCRAEIKDLQPQWYSANGINDGFQPKSISELFSSEAPFSTANPIIVSSINSHDDIRMLSTLSPPTSLSSSTRGFTKTSTQFPPTSLSTQLSSFLTSQPPLPQYSTTPPPFQQYVPSMTQPVDVQPIPQRNMMLELQSLPQRNVQIQQDQTASTQSLPPVPQVVRLTTFSQPMETTMPQNMRVELVPQSQTSIQPDLSTPGPPQNIPLSNYFLIYQQAPQSIQGYSNPSSSPGTTLGESFSTSAPPITSTFPTFSSSSPTFSTLGSSSITFDTTPVFSTTSRPPVTQNLGTSTLPRVTVTSLSTIGTSSSLGSSTNGARLLNCTLASSTTPIPRLASGRPLAVPVNPMFPLKISVRGPSGSITNVNFNPVVKAPATPKPTPKTTRKPTTRRTPKPKRNTYDRCLQGCRKNGQTLCAAPLSQIPVDPKNLRGFPSVCHMACHNSYRKDPYEKVTDGSCSKLRNRIRPIDSNSKLKKEELHKVQYFLDNTGPAIVEVSGAYS